MSLLMGGVIAVVIGLISLFVWRMEFLDILKGSLPIFLFLGGALAIYVGFDEMQDKIREEKRRRDEELERAKEEIESAKAEAWRYREELEKIRDEKGKSEGNT